MGRYLHNMAKSMIGQLGIEIEDLCGFGVLGYGAQELYASRSSAIKGSLRRMRPETLGRIVAQGKGGYRGTAQQGGTSMYLVHRETYLDRYADGWSLLIEIACTAIVAEMTNILAHRKEVEERRRNRRTEQLFARLKRENP